MIKRLIHGSRKPGVAYFESARKTSQDTTLTSGTPGLEIFGSPGGSILRYADPMRTRWVYIIRIHEALLVAKEAYRGDTSSAISSNDHDIITGRPAPGYTMQHFEFFVLDQGQPQPLPADRACLYIGGFFVPDFRMLLVEPVAVEDLCEPCGEPANA